MTAFGVTLDGFVVKPVDAILSDAIARATAVFGDVDLTSTSALRKILETTAAEDGELWKSLEDLYYGNFMSTAVGDALDLLGEDVGLERAQLPSSGTIQVSLSGAVPNRQYVLPEGAILVATGPPPQQTYGTTAPVTLDDSNPKAFVDAIAFEPGPDGDVGAQTINTIDPAYGRSSSPISARRNSSSPTRRR